MIKSVFNTGRLTRLALAVGGLSAALCSSSASAQLCAPKPKPIPGFSSFAPVWAPPLADGTSPPNSRWDLNEPRWASSIEQVFVDDMGNTNTNEGGYRLMVNDAVTELAVSVQQRGDNSIKNGWDAVWFGIWNPATKQGGVIKVPLHEQPGVPPAPLAAAIAPYFYKGTVADDPLEAADTSNDKIYDYSFVPNANPALDGTWSSLQKIPGSIVPNTVASWTKQGVEAGGADWGIQFKVDLTKVGITTGTAYRYTIIMQAKDVPNALDGTLNGPVQVGVPVVNVMDTTRWIDTGTSVDKNPVNWAAGPSVGAACPGGVYVAGMGTGNDDQVYTSDGSQNQWWARLGFPAGGTPPAKGTVLGKIRIAEWGAQLDNNAGDVAQWQVIPMDPAQISATEGTTGAVLNGGMYAGQATLANVFGGALDYIEFKCPMNALGKTCTLPTPPLNDVAPDGTKSSHQCMHVQLSKPLGSPVTFSDTSAYRNMSFVSLSERTITSKISIKGMQAKYGVIMPRDVMIKVIPRNMPTANDVGVYLNTALMNLLKLGFLGLNQAVNPGAMALTPEAQMKIVWPTLETHVYYDTGKKTFQNGKSLPIFKPLNAYGHFASHEGIHYGFTTTARNASTNLAIPSAGREGFFKVKIPNEGSFSIKQGISANELPKWLLGPNPQCAIFPWSC